MLENLVDMSNFRGVILATRRVFGLAMGFLYTLKRLNALLILADPVRIF
jgi:hypothetical protein